MSSAQPRNPIRVAVVGLGWAARSIWLPRLAAHPEFQVEVGVERDPAVRATAADEFPGLRTVATAAELDPRAVDLAVVAVPNHLHAPVSRELLSAGVAVFVEKPVCLTSAEALELAEAERAGETLLLAGSAARHRADVRTLAEQVAKLGTIRHVELAWVRSRGIPSAGGWFTTRALAGGGALVDLGWHLMDVLTALLGPLRFDKVIGSISDDFLHDESWRAAWRAEANARGGDVEDTARAFLSTHEGLTVALRASWASHEPLDTTSIRVEGSAGTVELRCTFGFSPNRSTDPPSVVVTADGRREVIRPPQEDVGAEYDRQLNELSALLETPQVRGRAVLDAQRTISVVEDIYTSAGRARG